MKTYICLKKYSKIVIFLLLGLTLIGCNSPHVDVTPPDNGSDIGNDDTNLGGFDDSFGDDLSNSGIYDGVIDDEENDVIITCESGTDKCYSVDGSTITFNEISEDSIYSISGELNGNIIINVGDTYKFDLELKGLSLASKTTNPILILSGNEVSITAKKDYKNYIYDNREAVDSTLENVYSAAIHSLVDLEICGKGELTIVSEYNNGIHSKDDLQVKNLTLFIKCVDNALKGNDSISIENGNTTLIATKGDCLKTTNSDISEKGNQRGNITIIGGTHTLYAACDGIDASHNVNIEDSTTVLNIYTDKYSNYSDEVTAVDSTVYYVRYSNSNYKYSIKYYNSDEDYIWVNPTYHSTVTGGNRAYYYYSFPKNNNYSKIQLFAYTSTMEQSQDENYAYASELLTQNAGYDTLALSSSRGSFTCNWTNYTTAVQNAGPGGMGGGMQEGNTDKGDYSTKGIKAANEIVINDGTINIKAYDDAIHANKDVALENGNTPTGNITINGGKLTIYSNDDGIHADGTLSINNGTIYIANSYEGLEGTVVNISAGNVSVLSSDDGINSTATTNTGITITGGVVYILAGGDGIDANSQTSYSGIVFSGGNTVVISTSNGNSAIDSERGYKYTAGSVVAIMPSGGMSSEAINCSNFSSIGTNKTISLTANSYLVVTVNSTNVVTIKMPKAVNGRVIYLGSNQASYSTSSSSSETLDNNGIYWK